MNKREALTASSLSIFPNQLPDESLFSVISESFLLSRSKNSGNYLNRLLGVKNAILGNGLPSRIGVLSKYLKKNDIILKSKEIIDGLTLAPYFSAFLTPQLSKCLQQRMISSDGRAIKIGLGLVAQGLGAAEPLKQCEACRHDDFSQYGRPYWHRSHQLPGVTVCHIHDEILTEINCCAHLISRHILFLPISTNARPSSDYRTENQDRKIKIHERSNEFSQWSHLLLQAALRPCPLERWRTLYINRLMDLGYCTTNGNVYQRELAEYVRNYHHEFDYLLYRNTLTIPGSRELPWLTRLVRKPRGTQHPIHHLLLAMALFSDWSEFEAAINKSIPCKKPINKPKTKKNLNSFIKQLIDKNGKSVRQTAALLGVSVTTVCVIAKQLGLNIAVRPKHIDSKKINTTRRLLSQGVPLSEIAHRAQLSQVSVRRILRSHPTTNNRRKKIIFNKERNQRRKQLEEYTKKLINADRQTIRRLCYKNVTWLRRHDKKWLDLFLLQFPKTNAKPKPRVDWSKRDRELLVKLKKSYREIRNNPGKPIRVSTKELGRRVSKLDWIDKHLNKLPKCRIYITNIVETRLDFRLRRVKWALCELQKRGQTATGWRIRRLAGIGLNEEPEITNLIESMTASNLGYLRLA